MPARLRPIRAVRRRHGGLSPSWRPTWPHTGDGNMLLPGGATPSGMMPDEMRRCIAGDLLDPAIMGPPVVWLASPASDGLTDQRIIARNFADWLQARERT